MSEEWDCDVHSYHVTYRTPEGEMRECDVQGRNHVEATAHLVDAGMTDVEVISRDEVHGSHLDRNSRSVLLALLIAVPIGIAAFWYIARRML